MTIKAEVILGSRTEHAPTLWTIMARYPKFIHGELMTHRDFSRNASSSRAIPVPKMIKDVYDDPVYPSHWGANQRGMQAGEECHEMITNPRTGERFSREMSWDEARIRAVEMAQAFADAGYHKQIVNRLLEPFCHINVLISSTNWSNFFVLRDHPAAQPEIQILAREIKDAMDRYEPRLLMPGEWHLPYVRDEEMLVLQNSAPNQEELLRTLRLISTARCARVSYRTQEGRDPMMTEDLSLAERLLGTVPLHASPAEHQASPDTPNPRGWDYPELHGNFEGWVQHRKTLPGECQ